MLCAGWLTAADLPDSLFLKAGEIQRQGLSLEHAGKGEDALMKYLEARKIYASLVTDHPHWSGNTSRVPSRLKTLDERLRPLCLLHQIPPSSVLKDPWAERAMNQTPAPSSSGGKSHPSGKQSLAEQIAQLQRLQAAGHKTVPQGFGTPANPTPKPGLQSVLPPPLAPTPLNISGDPAKVNPPSTPIPVGLTSAEEMARIQAERQKAEQDLQRERFAWQQKEREYQARLREALAARPKALEPGEMAKQMSANRQLRTDFEFLKVASKRGESELLQALDNLEDARRENEALLKQYRALQAENARLRRVISGGR